jgi:hypothetical protein
MSEHRQEADQKLGHLIGSSGTPSSGQPGLERRDSPRREIALDVRELCEFRRPCVGDLSVGGASYVSMAPPVGPVVELMFSVPTYPTPITAVATVVGWEDYDTKTIVHTAFARISLEAELAIARWFDQLS